MSRRRQPHQQQANGLFFKPTTNDWIQVKRIRLTLEERIQKRRALIAHARNLVREAQKLKQKRGDQEATKATPSMETKVRNSVEKKSNTARNSQTSPD